MPATVAMIGLTHPHSRMYLETLDVTDDVGAIVLCDADLGAARDWPRATRRRRRSARRWTRRWPIPA